MFGRQVEFEHMHGKRDIPDDDVRKGYIDVLEKAYRETREQKKGKRRPRLLTQLDTGRRWSVCVVASL